jgi:hypothetical protein
MKCVRHSDIVRYSDVKEDGIEIPRIFVESRDLRERVKGGENVTD